MESEISRTSRVPVNDKIGEVKYWDEPFRFSTYRDRLPNNAFVHTAWQWFEFLPEA